MSHFKAVCPGGELGSGQVKRSGNGTIYSSVSAANRAIEKYKGTEVFVVEPVLQRVAEPLKSMTSKVTYTLAAFDALCTLLRVRASPSREAARLVLVEGVTGLEAARQTGLTPGGVSNAVKPIRQARKMAAIAASD